MLEHAIKTYKETQRPRAHAPGWREKSTRTPDLRDAVPAAPLTARQKDPNKGFGGIVEVLRGQHSRATYFGS